MIQINSICKNYFTKHEVINALENINLTIPNKGMIFICGNSGSGKTTLLNCLGGLDDFDSGNIQINDCIYDKKVDTKHFGYVFQEYHLLNYLSVYDNLSIALGFDDEQKIDEVLYLVGLKGYQKKKVIDLSGGEKQRIAIARALLNGGNFLLCDEPTGSLDKKISEQIFDILKSLSKTKTVIVVSHDEISAKKYADRIITLEDGKVFEDVSFDQNEEISIKNHYFNNKRRLNFKTMIKIATKVMFARPIISIISLLLSCLSVIMLSVSLSINNKNQNETIVMSMMENGNTCLVINKTIKDENNNEYVDNLNQIDLEQLEQLSQQKPYLIYKFGNGRITNANISIITNGYSEISSNLLDEFKYTLLYGEMPIKDNEAIISEYIFSLLQKNGIKNTNGVNYPKTYADIIGMPLAIDDIEFEICGIVDTNFNFDRYASIIETDYDNSGFKTGLEYSFHTTLFVKQGTYKHPLLTNYGDYIDDYTYQLQYFIKNNGDLFFGGQTITANDIPETYKIVIKDEKSIDQLKNNEIVVPFSLAMPFSLTEYLNLGARKYAYLHFEEIEDLFAQDYPDGHTVEDYIDYLIINNYKDFKYCQVDKDELFDLGIKEFLERNPQIFSDCFNKKYSLGFKLDSINELDIEEVEIVGLYYQDYENFYNNSELYTCNDLLTSLKQESAYYFDDIAYCVFAFNDDFNHNLKLYSLLDNYYEPSEYYCYSYGTKIKISGYSYLNRNENCLSYISNLNNLNNLANISKYISLGMIVVLFFVIILHIVSSVNISFVNIGILKSLNYNINEIAKIYVFIPTVVFMLLAVISNCLSILVINILNHYQIETQMLLFSAYNFSYFVFLLSIVGISILVFTTSILALFSAYKKPINHLINKVDK